MTETVIGLIPNYGLLVIFAVVSLACLALPLPSSMMVLASGAFAATGDLTLWQVIAVAFVAFVVGDQVAFGLAARVGPRLLSGVRSKPRLAPVLTKSEAMLEARGQVAVLLSHTVLSPTCPYISYLCGAGGMKWASFSLMATFGAAIWVSVYVLLGYAFATQLTQVAEILSKFLGLLLALGVVVFCMLRLRRNWQAQLAEGSVAPK